MASVRYRKRGDSNLWTYEIRNEGKTVAHNSGFKTKKLAESEAEPILQELRLGKRISRDISLVDLYQEWLELKILPSSRSEETKKKYLLRKNTIERLFGNLNCQIKLDFSCVSEKLGMVFDNSKTS